MLYRIEVLRHVYSVDVGDHDAWRPVKGDSGQVLTWSTKREAEAFTEILLDPSRQMRVVEHT